MEAEGGLGTPRDPYAPYASPVGGEQMDLDDPWAAHDHTHGHSASTAQLVPPPTTNTASPFIRADQYDRDEDESEFDARSRFTSTRGPGDTESQFGGSESYAPSRNMFTGAGAGAGGGGGADKGGLTKEAALAGEIQEGETTEIVKESSARRRWVALCWALTFWLPNPCLTYIGRMKRMDVRQAWREKLALNIMIWFLCACSIFVIAVLGLLICPTQHVYSTTELAGHSVENNPNSVLTSIRGEVFDLNGLTQLHLRTVSVVKSKEVLKYGGKQIDDMFPVQISAVCDGIDGNLSPYIAFNPKNSSDPNSQYHDFRSFTNDSRPDWYFEQMITMRYLFRRGFLGYTPKEIKNMAHNSRSVGVYNGLIYDVTDYINSGPRLQPPDGFNSPNVPSQFMDQKVLDVFRFNSDGGDITKQLDRLDLDPQVLRRQKTCLRNLFTVGKVDNRNSAQCQFATYILLAISIIMIAVIGFKFLASINFSSPRAPEDHDKFVICQVPCYTEGDASLRKTIDSLAQLKYDDKRKLLVIICDGMIVGSGNDRPTPRIVLDILGADPNLDPEPLSFVSLGEGAKQHNMGKIYSGLYECSGHVVPYLVVVKVGKPNERSRPGNRGKRDSQMVLMHFLNKVHFNAPMNPLELEMYHQIKNVIGVNPTFYEYLFTVDADTTVDKFSVNRLISAMIHDKKLLGVCGETELANAKQSIITMMQVYEYFISHHMAKAFESLFGSVTCLPGCFTLYRLRTPDTHKPLLISNQIITDYSENRVDTLHMKNLLHLGEDRYLTTLLLKHFPSHKTQFVRDAHAYTVAPDDWKVLLSQRRRWINSTVHNLGELVFLDQLCGFCCFSMRFVVMIDLVSTLIQPVTVVYIVYLIVNVARGDQSVPVQSLIMLAAIYGLQAFVFILRRKWDMIGWMIFYIIAIPAFSFLLPLYSFWRMDDFSWGATRLVLGESGKKIIVHDEGKFDPRAIPLKTWSDYENELWDKESNHSIGSWVPPTKFKNEGYAESHTASLYGRETVYEPGARDYSPSPSGMYPPPGYQSGRNTPLSHMGMPMAANMSMASFGGPLMPMPTGGSMGMLHQPTPSRPQSNYLDLPFNSRSPNASPPSPGQQPSDAEIERAVREILRHVDLNTATRRELRRKLEEQFGTDLTARRGVINAAIDRCLAEAA
ncbi:chitin synthase [Moniliophthora roreri MCA 2997]|nr:chitin synthase [Moniliophthora roreri MCA 2997]